MALLRVWAKGVHRGRHLGYTPRGAGAGPPSDKISFSDDSNIRFFVRQRGLERPTVLVSSRHVHLLGMHKCAWERMTPRGSVPPPKIFPSNFVQRSSISVFV